MPSAKINDVPLLALVLGMGFVLAVVSVHGTPDATQLAKARYFCYRVMTVVAVMPATVDDFDC